MLVSDRPITTETGTAPGAHTAVFLQPKDIISP